MENKIFMKLIEEKQKIDSKINIEVKLSQVSTERRENMTEYTLTDTGNKGIKMKSERKD